LGFLLAIQAGHQDDSDQDGCDDADDRKSQLMMLGFTHRSRSAHEPANWHSGHDLLRYLTSAFTQTADFVDLIATTDSCENTYTSSLIYVAKTNIHPVHTLGIHVPTMVILLPGDCR
jgi:hypothetical protein